MAELVFLTKIDKFLDELNDESRAKISTALDLLKDYGHELRYPYSKKITRNIFELRAKGDQLVRLFFGYRGGKIYILTGFIKKTQKTPRAEIERAEKAYKDLDI